MLGKETTPQAKTYGLVILMIFTFFMVIGFEMIMPLVVGQYVNVQGFSATSVAVALSLRRFMQQGLALLGGAMADRWDLRHLISLGVLLRALGFVLLAHGSQYLLLLLAMVLIGLGGVFFDLPYQTAIATLTTLENRARYYSLNNTVTGIASTVGPLVGALLLKVNFAAVCYGAAACFAINFFVSVLALPKIRRRERSYSVGRSVWAVVSNRAFLLFTGAMVIFWLAASQIDISFPLKIQALAGTQESVSLMYAIYAAITAALQYPLVSLLLKRFQPAALVLMGVACIALALLVAGGARTQPLFLAAVALFALGMLLARPNQQTIAVALADDRALGMFLGVISMSAAIGCGVGSIFGGVCFDLAAGLGNDQVAWGLFAAIALLALGCFLPVKIHLHMREKES